MKLFEYEAKAILAEHGIPIPNGSLASSPTEAKEVAGKLKSPYIVKAQVLVSGRGKAGGIQSVKTINEVEGVASRVLNSKIKGLKVKSVWVEEKIEMKRELYFGITIDRSKHCYVVMASISGGVDIEEVALQTPEKIIKRTINPKLGFRSYHARQMTKTLGYSGKLILDLATIFEKLYKIAVEYDAELAEMNPLIETANGSFVAADARLIIDNNALYRHPQYRQRLLSSDTELTEDEVTSLREGLAYVKLDGNIGIMGNGAGLVMATLDMVQLYGGNPANFLDVGGGASKGQVMVALQILLSIPQVSVVFINILGGITRCDEVARGILETREKKNLTKPLVVRLVGTNEVEGQRILEKAGIQVLDSMEEAAEMAVELSTRRV